jgi:hypothetical protein
VSTESVDYCHIQYPLSVDASPEAGFDVYIWVYEAGVTAGVGAGAGIEVELGIGSDGTIPSDDWTWTDCSYAGDKDGLFAGDLANDEHLCVGTAPVDAGSYDYAGRVSIDGGPWLNCDVDTGAATSGSDDGYSVDTTGVLNVVAP